jgi:hypothetical protein
MQAVVCVCTYKVHVHVQVGECITSDVRKLILQNPDYPQVPSERRP